MGADCNLDDLDNFFKFFMCILERSLQLIMVYSSYEKNLDILFPSL